MTNSIQNTKKQIGNMGESLAERFLKKRNHKIMDRNFHSRLGEVDIVTFDKKTKELVFAEVKARTSSRFGWPELAVTSRKRLKMAKAAKRYLKEHKISFKTNYRFDILAVELDYLSRKARITHFKYV